MQLTIEVPAELEAMVAEAFADEDPATFVRDVFARELAQRAGQASAAAAGQSTVEEVASAFGIELTPPGRQSNADREARRAEAEARRSARLGGPPGPNSAPVPSSP